MEKKIIHQFEKWLEDQKLSLQAEKTPVLVHYFGSFKEDLIYRLSETIEEKLLANNISYTIIKKVFSSVTEAINNIITHGHSSEISVGGLLVYIKNDTVKVLIVNITETVKKQQISSSINDLNSLTPKELNNRFTELMKRSIISNTPNLGIGLLSIRINSSTPITFDFHPLNEELMLFALQFGMEGVSTPQKETVTN